MTSEPAPTSSPRQHLWFAAVVAALTFGCFWPAIAADFVLWDDDVNLFENPHIRGLTADNLRWMFTDLAQTLRYKPLNWLAWAAIYELAGLKPAAFHLANVLLHSLNAGLAYVLFAGLLGARGGAVPVVRTRLCAAAGALAWSLHPLRVEPVAWATGLPYDLALLFALASAALYWRFATGPAGLRAGESWAYRGALVCYLLALLTYPIILGLSVVPVVMDWWLARQRGRPAPLLRARHWPFLVGAALLVGMNVLGRLTPNTIYVEAAPLANFSALDRAMQGCFIWAYFLVRHIWTAGLSVVYYDLVGFNSLSWPFLASGGFVVLASAVLFRWRQRWPALWLVWVCHLIWLVPVLGLTESQHSPADRYTYASGLLVGLLVAMGLHCLAAAERWRLGLMGAGAGLALFALQSSLLIPVWHDSGRLFRHVLALLEKDEHRSIVWGRLGHWHLLRKELAEATFAFQQALPGARDRPDLHLRIACALQEQGRFPDALPHFEIALSAGRLTDEFMGDYGIAMVAVGRLDAAEKQFAEAVRLAPGKARHRRNWALTLKRLGRDQEAAAQEAAAQQLTTPARPDGQQPPR